MGSLSALLLIGLLGTGADPCAGDIDIAVPCPCANGRAQVAWELYDPQPGDLIFFRVRRATQNLLYYLACAGGVTHVAIVVRRPDGDLVLLEAPGPAYPVMLTDIPSRLHSYDGRIFVRRRRTPLTPQQSTALTEFACAQDGKTFRTWGIILPMFASPVNRTGSKCCGPADLDAPRWFCSPLVAAAGVVAGLLDPCVVRPKFTDPEDLYTDKHLDLSCGWEKPLPCRCRGERGCGWWSRSCSGDERWWK